MSNMIECGTCGYPLTPEERTFLIERNGRMVSPEDEKSTELSLLVKEFFENYLNIVEESESGRAFNPVGISCCRVLLLQPLDNLLHRMRVLSGAKPNPIGDYDE